MNEEIKTAIIRALPFAIILFILFIATKRKKIEIVDLGIKKPSSINHYLFWVIGFFIFILLTEFSLSKLGFLEIDKWHHSLFPSIIRIIGVVILAPIAEEFIFRGLLLSVLTPIKQEYYSKFRLLFMRLIFSLKLDVYPGSISLLG